MGRLHQQPRGPGELNSDGDADIFGIDSNSCAYIYHGDGAGDFYTNRLPLGCTGWSAYKDSITGAGDLNGDGEGDLVGVNSSTGCMFYWPGNGSGGLGTASQIGCGWAPYQGQLAGMGDLNGDGDGDLIGINRTTNCAWRWLGDGNGGFGTAIQQGCTGWSTKVLVR